LAGGHEGGYEQMSPIPPRGSAGRDPGIFLYIFNTKSCILMHSLAWKMGITSVFIKTHTHWEKWRLLEEAAKPKAESGVELLWMRQQAPPARRSGGALWASQRGSGRSSDRPNIFHYFQHSGWPLLTLYYCGSQKKWKILKPFNLESIIVHLVMLFDVFFSIWDIIHTRNVAGKRRGRRGNSRLGASPKRCLDKTLGTATGLENLLASNYWG